MQKPVKKVRPWWDGIITSEQIACLLEMSKLENDFIFQNLHYNSFAPRWIYAAMKECESAFLSYWASKDPLVQKMIDTGFASGYFGAGLIVGSPSKEDLLKLNLTHMCVVLEVPEGDLRKAMGQAMISYKPQTKSWCKPSHQESFERLLKALK